MAILKKGDKGPKVKALQEKLNKAGARPKLKVDSIFLEKTEKAVRDLQKKAGLKVDGKAGPATTDALASGGRPVKWTLKDTMREHKQVNTRIDVLKKDRIAITKLAKQHAKNKDLKEAFRTYNIYADALAKQLNFMKQELERIDWCKTEFDGGAGSGAKDKAFFLGQAQDSFKSFQKRTSNVAKLERAYNAEHDGFLEVLDSVPA